MDTQRDYHLIHANVAHARGPLDGPVMASFMAQLDEINALGHSSPGFVAQPTPPDTGTVFAGLYLLNVTVWESVEALAAYTHQGKHAAALERRAEWFHQSKQINYVLYWVPRGHVATEKEIKERLDHLRKFGPTPNAFSFEQPFTVAQALGFKPK